MTPERYNKIKTCISQRQPDLTVVMENVHKEHNLAAIARTCDAVGIGKIYASTELEKINLSQNASSGSDRWMEVKCFSLIEDIYYKLRKMNFQILAAHFDSNAVDYKEIDYTVPTAIVVGQELEGLSEKAVNKADQSIIIPMHGMVQSLNVSVAAAVILFEAQRQREKAGMYVINKFDDQTVNKIIFEKSYPRIAKLYRSQNKIYPTLDENGNIVIK